MKPKTPAAKATKKHIEPVTLTVTLTGRKAAAFRRMARYDEQTHQESAMSGIVGIIDAFTEMEASDRLERKRKAAGIARPEFAFCPEFVGRLADGIANQLDEAGLQLVAKGGAR